MEKKDIHFIGFLANVDDSILKLNLGHSFTIEKKTQKEIMPFLCYIEKHYGREKRMDISPIEWQGDTPIKGRFYYCITAKDVTSFECTPQGGVVGKRAEVKRIYGAIRDKTRLLRLYKEGNILLGFSCMYYMKNSEPSVIASDREGPIADWTKFVLSDNDILEAQSFMEKTKIPFKEDFIQLAFESFELSYEIGEPGLAFLSLMIALEVMFTKEREGLSYALSRNTAALLGNTREEATSIFLNIKNLCRKRGGLVHAGKRKEITTEDILQVRDYVRKAIKEIKAIDKSKNEVIKILNISGFGQRPWRDGC